jgi:hypothetical protein
MRKIFDLILLPEEILMIHHFMWKHIEKPDFGRCDLRYFLGKITAGPGRFSKDS